MSIIDDTIVVLHVDDEPDLLDLCATFLERNTARIEVLTATSPDEGLDIIEKQNVDCIVSDYDMPGKNGLDFLKAVRDNHPDLPFILFTEKGSEEVASGAISEGVTDYLQKESGTVHYEVLSNRIENAVDQYQSRREFERMNIAIDTVDAGIAFLDEEGEFLYVNPAYSGQFGYRTEELVGEHIELLYPEELQDQVYDDLLPIVPQEGEWSGTSVHLTKGGRRVNVSQ